MLGGDQLEIQLLARGPRVLVENRPVDTGAPKERLILAVLAHSVGRLVPTQRLVRDIWGQDPPSAVNKSLHSHISRIRKSLAGAGVGNLVLHRSGGYLLAVPEETVDLSRARDLEQRAHAHALRGEHREAVDLCDLALDLWSEEPLSELQGDWAWNVREECAHLHAQLLARWAESALALDRAAHVCERVNGHGVSEPLTFVHMRALVAEGRHAEAIECYGRLRAHTREMQGTEPNPRTRDLHQRILEEADEPSSWGPSGTPPRAAAADPTVPSVPETIDTLRADTPDFVGREEEIDTLLTRVRRVRRAPCIQLITGLGGTGKTTLAVHVAHLVREDFDLRLDVELGANRADVALGRLLAMVGVPEEAIPAGTEARVHLWRSRVADRRVLLLLDNVACAEDLGLLVPGSSACVVLATARRSMTGVGVGQSLRIGALEEEDSVRLFALMTGRPVEGLARVARLLRHLPIELRFGAAHLGRHPTWSLDHLAERLQRQRRITGGWAYAVFSDSLELLSPMERRTFLCAGLHPTATVTEDVLWEAVGSQEDVERSMDELLDTHFVDEIGPGRYRIHDHVRDFAEWYAERNMTAGERESVMRRYFDHYLTALDSADRKARPGRRRMGPPLDPGTSTPVFADVRCAREWFADIYPVMDALLHQARTQGADSYVARFPLAMAGLLESVGPLDRAEDHLRWSYEAWRNLGHEVGQADALYELGLVRRQRGDHTEAEGLLRRAFDLWKDSGATHQVPHARSWLAWLRHLQGRQDEARGEFSTALNEFRILGDRRGMAKVHHHRAYAEQSVGQYELADADYETATHIYREVGDVQREASVVTGHASVLYDKGLYRHAEEMFERSRRVFQDHRDISGVALSHLNLGVTALYRLSHGSALASFEAALWYFRITGEEEKTVKSTAGIGMALLGLGRVQEARMTLESGLEHVLRSETGLPRARLLRALGDVREAEGQLHEARWCYSAAMRAAQEERVITEEGQACERLGDLSDRSWAEADALMHWQRAAQILERVPNPYLSQVRLKIEMTLDGMSGLSG